MTTESKLVVSLAKLSLCDNEADRKVYKDQVSEFLNEILGPVSVEVPDSTEVTVKDVSNLLHHLGMPSHILGYAYTREAIMMCIKDRSLIHSITKTLYPEVAKTFNTTGSRVERAIRHSIEVVWDRGDLDVLQKFFGYTISLNKGKPTNSEFISLIVDYLAVKD